MKKILFVLSFAALGAAPFFATAQASEKSREEVRAAFDSCRETLGLGKSEPGQRPVAPTDEERTKMDSCLSENGIQLSDLRGKGGHHGHHRRPNSEPTNQPLGGQ